MVPKKKKKHVEPAGKANERSDLLGGVDGNKESLSAQLATGGTPDLLIKKMDYTQKSFYFDEIPGLRKSYKGNQRIAGRNSNRAKTSS